MKMPVFSIDPGITTGIGEVGADGKPTLVAEVQGPEYYREIVNLVLQRHKYYNGNLFITIEDFVGLGKRSGSIVFTIKLVGWLEHFFRYHNMIGAMNPPQFRKFKLGEASRLIKGRGWHHTPHTCDALAHALAQWEYLR